MDIERFKGEMSRRGVVFDEQAGGTVNVQWGMKLALVALRPRGALNELRFDRDGGFVGVWRGNAVARERTDFDEMTDEQVAAFVDCALDAA